MSRDLKRVTVYLFGGLGNQLFQYFAGLATAKAIGAKLYLKPYGQTPVIGRENEIGLAALRTEGTIVSTTLPSWLQEKFLRNFVKIFSKNRLKEFSSKRGVFFSDSFNLQSLKNQQHDHIRLIGYFQDYEFVKSLEQNGTPPVMTLVNPSSWYINLQREAMASRPIIIHIRRGDYLSHSNTIGVLDFAYFKNALSKIPQNEYSKFWIFSDSIAVAENFAQFANLVDLQTKIVCAPSDSSAAESMSLMSMGSALVMSNSTYSWWSAYFNQSAEFIVAPTEWFRNLDSPQNLIPANWIRCDSVWKD